MKKLGWMERSQSWPRRAFLQASAGWLGTQWFGVHSPKALARDAKTTPSSSGFVRLFNGKDLRGLYGWLKDTKYKDPRKVFSVEDGILKISGEVAGYLATEKEYRDYHLVVEYKWGAKTYGAKTARNSGILLHAVGSDGNPSPWMSSIECQVAQGCVGDFIAMEGARYAGLTPTRLVDRLGAETSRVAPAAAVAMLLSTATVSLQAASTRSS